MRRKPLNIILEENVGEALSSINTIAIAKITKINNSKMMCSIKLLDMPEILGVRDEVEEIDNVPIAPLFWGTKAQINAPLSIGDKVIVGFCQHGTFNSRNSEEVVEAEHYSRFDINNAIVIAFLTNDSTTSKFPNDFYVMYGSNYIKMNDTNVEIKAPSIKLDGNVEITGNLENKKNVTTQGNTTTSGQTTTNGIISNGKDLDNHKHKDSLGGATSGPL